MAQAVLSICHCCVLRLRSDCSYYKLWSRFSSIIFRSFQSLFYSIHYYILLYYILGHYCVLLFIILLGKKHWIIYISLPITSHILRSMVSKLTLWQLLKPRLTIIGMIRFLIDLTPVAVKSFRFQNKCFLHCKIKKR